MPRAHPIVVRKATQRDMDYIVERWRLIVGDLVAGHVHFRPSRHAPEIARARLLTQLERPDARVFVAMESRNRAGFLNASVYERSPLFNPEEIGLIENLFVEPGMRRHHVGSALLREAVSWFRSRKIRAIEAVTPGNNPGATAFFGSHGFDLMSVTLLLDLETAGKRLDQATRRTRKIIGGRRNG